MKDFSSPPEFAVPEIIAVANPAAGAQWTQTVPNNTIWLINNVEFQLLTDITVINRIGRVEIFDGTTNTRIAMAGFNQAASLTINHMYKLAGHGLNATNQGSGDLAHRLYLRPTWIIRSNVANLQAGDALTAISLYIQRWLINF